MGPQECLGSGLLPSLPPLTAGNASKSPHVLLLRSLNVKLRISAAESHTHLSSDQLISKWPFFQDTLPSSSAPRLATSTIIAPTAQKAMGLQLLLKHQNSFWIQKPLQAETPERWVLDFQRRQQHPQGERGFALP